MGGKVTGVAVGSGVRIGNGVGNVTGVAVGGMVAGVAVGWGVAVAMPVMAVAILASVVASISSVDGPQAASMTSSIAANAGSSRADVRCLAISRNPRLAPAFAPPHRSDR